MTIKWNWGTGLTIAYTAFVVFMLGMVYMCTQQDYDLVTNDYYADELKYQQVIDGMNNADALSIAVAVAVNENNVAVNLPMQTINGTGEVKFYRPDNAALDFTVPFTSDGKIEVSTKKFKPGIYKVKTTWTNENKPYYNEQSLFIP